MGEKEAKRHQPLVKRSQRQYEIVMVVNPGKTVCGVALGAVNPEGHCSFVTGKDTWPNIQQILKYVDVFVGCYWNIVEEAQCVEFTEVAKTHGCETKVEFVRCHEIPAILPTRQQRAQIVLELLLHPRGITTYKEGKYFRSYFDHMLPRVGEKI